MTRGGDARQRGAAAVEFAIVLPLLFLVLFGIVEFSIIMYDKAQITSASRNGARFGTMWRPDSRPSCNEIIASSGPVRSYENGLVNFSGSKEITPKCLIGNAEVTGAASICTQDGHELLTVRATFDYNFLVIPNFVTSISGPLTLVSETVMRCE